MKLIINIPEREYKVICENNYVAVCACPNLLSNAIKNGIPIPDKATNRDIIKVMFDTTEEHFYDEDRMVDVYGLDRTDEPSTFYADWWNSPYQKGGKE